MRFVIGGGSGFLGRSLTSALLSAGHHVQILTRHAGPPHSTHTTLDYIPWSPDGNLGPWTTPCAAADAIINLAGESIGTARWSAARKTRLVESRLLATRSLVRFVREAAQPPSTFVSASAIGFYGDRGDDALTEDDGPGRDFLAELAASWEREALVARSDTTRVVLLRTGIVLDPHEGALAKMLTPFRIFAGGPFASGRQYMSWIHLDDWVSMVRWAIDTPTVRGPLNLTSPHPLTNREFARTLGRALRRPAILPAPGFALKLVLGEMAAPLLLFSQRIVPARALAGGFHFAHECLDEALADLLPSPQD